MRSIESVLQEPYAGLGEGLLLGVKQAIGKDLEEIFRTSGIVHIVVLSGYNVMLVVTFVLFLLSFFLARKTRIIVGLFAIAAFALLVGLSATVVRASIMASLLLVADLLGRRYDLVRALLFAATVMVFINPYLLVYDIGFQLSFMATLGLILVAPVFESFVTEGFAKLSVKDFLISTVATQIAVLPLLVYHIGEVSLVAVIVNVLVLPIVPLSMLLTFFSGVVAFISVPLALPISFLAYLTLRYIIEVAAFFASLPLASIIIPPISAGFAVLMYAVLGYIVLHFKNRKQKDNKYSDWVIEDESEIQSRAGEGLRPSPAQPDVPVFFR
jgi:competence protein ComEC